MSNLTPPPYPPSQPAVGAGAAPEHGPYSFVDAIKVGFRKYATFSGRARASEYWYWVLFATLASSVAGGGAAVQGIVDIASGDGSSGGAGVGGFSSLVNLALFLPSLAVAFRRLHDTGRSGLWVLLPGALSVLALILFIGAFGVGLIGLTSQEGDTADLSSVGGGAVGLAIAGGVVGLGAFATWILLIVWMTSDGGPNVPNKYGVRD